ncbi:MAG: cell division protein FtsA [Patescibacteria group bacterium]|jgi:cell division protein FtsA
MPNDQIFAGIDIGSCAVRIVVGQRLPVGDKESVHILGAAETVSEGVSRGTVISIEDAVSTVSSCLERVERMTGVPVSSAMIAIPGTHVSSLVSKGVVAVARPDGEIREDDVVRAIEAAQNIATPVNFEIIHVIPKTFTVDSQPGVKDPVGMTGIRLEVDAQIVQGLSAHIKNLTKCVYRTGVNIDDLVLGILAAAEVVVTPRQKELGVAVVNIGGSTTSIVVFEQGDIMHLATLPIGADHITSDIAIGLRTSIDIAEKVKLNYGRAVSKDLTKREEINLKEMGADSDEMVSLKYVANIIQSRAEEILEKVDGELKKIDRSGMLPAGIVITGGGAKVAGLTDLAKQKLRLPVSLGYPIGVTSITDKVTDLGYTTAIGLMQWAMREAEETPARRKGEWSKSKPVEKVTEHLKKWFGAMVH